MTFQNNKDKYQFLVFSSPCSFPLSFAAHTWIVTNECGEMHRYEVWSYKERMSKDSGCVSRDFYSPFVGLSLLPGLDSSLTKLRYKPRLVGRIGGDEGSLAHQMIDFVKENYNKYLYKTDYHYFPGPNSNTFTQWILNKFPGCPIILPWNSFGRRYRGRDKSLCS